MPARDFIHDAVKQALIKDGWVITADPFQLKFKDMNLTADLRAEKLLLARRQNHQILVEVKSFLGKSFAKEFQLALGQYQVYASLIEAKQLPDQLYLAISDHTYRQHFQGAVAMIVERYQLHLLVVDIEKEEVMQWID